MDIMSKETRQHRKEPPVYMYISCAHENRHRQKKHIHKEPYIQIHHMRTKGDVCQKSMVSKETYTCRKEAYIYAPRKKCTPKETSVKRDISKYTCSATGRSCTEKRTSNSAVCRDEAPPPPPLLSSRPSISLSPPPTRSTGDPGKELRMPQGVRRILGGMRFASLGDRAVVSKVMSASLSCLRPLALRVCACVRALGVRGMRGVCTYVCMCVCVCICVYMYIYVDVDEYIYLCIFVYTYIHMYL